MIGSLLGEVSQGIYSVRQITEIMFAYLSHKLATARSAEITKIAADQTIGSLFNHGMYEFYINNGWPNASFKYTKIDFIEIMKKRLALGQESRSWEVALLLSKVLFGDRDAPHEVDDAALMYIRPVIETYKRALDDGESRIAYNGVKFTVETLTECSRTIVNSFARIQELGCIMNGEDRKRGAMMDGRFQVFESQTTWYRRYLES